MTPDEYKKELESLEFEFTRKKKMLAKVYALANNQYKVGDIFTDHLGSIKIESIGIHMGMLDSLPSCYYYGLELKKDGTPTKKENKRQAYQTNERK